MWTLDNAFDSDVFSESETRTGANFNLFLYEPAGAVNWEGSVKILMLDMKNNKSI